MRSAFNFLTFHSTRSSQVIFWKSSHGAGHLFFRQNELLQNHEEYVNQNLQTYHIHIRELENLIFARWQMSVEILNQMYLSSVFEYNDKMKGSIMWIE